MPWWWLACGADPEWFRPLPEPVECPLGAELRPELPAVVRVRLRLGRGVRDERALALTRGAATAWAACGTRLERVATERVADEPVLGGAGPALEGADQGELAGEVLAPLVARIDELRPPRDEIALELLTRVVGERSPLRRVVDVRGLGLSPALLRAPGTDPLLVAALGPAPFTPVAFVAVEEGADASVVFHELAHALGLGHAEQGEAVGAGNR